MFLDEVGELPSQLQVKLLRFLQEGEVRPIGSVSPVEVKTRVIAATHRDLRTEAKAGTFREDFFYRLSAYDIHLPPLRDRRSDIPLLVEHFRSRKTRTGDGDSPGPSPEVLELLAAHDWPGNVRELENLVQRALIDFGSLADSVGIRELLDEATGDPETTPRPPTFGDNLTIEEAERLHIEAVISRCEGNRTRAAEILGIDRKSLYRKVRRLGIEGVSGLEAD